MEGFAPEGMSTQAQQIWSMLDDMAQNDPAAYRKFIERQMSEGKEHMAPPDPHMCVQVMLLQGNQSKPLFINFLSWKRVPQPKSPEEAVPVTGAPISQEKDDRGAFALTSVAFNPKVLEEFGRNARNSADADTLVQLALDYVENEQKVKVSRTYTVLPESTPVKGDIELVRLCFTKAFQAAHSGKNGAGGDGGGGVFEKDVSKLEKTFGPLSSSEREGLLSQLSNIGLSGAGGKGSDGNNKGSQNAKGFGSSGLGTDNDASSDIKIPGLSGRNLNGSSSNGLNSSGKSSSGGLIQEIFEDKVSSTPPKYTLETTKDGGRSQLVLKVTLPGVKSVAECELDISEDDVKLVVPGRHDWKIKLPSCIDKDEAKARFSKKSSLLTLTMPVKS